MQLTKIGKIGLRMAKLFEEQKGVYFLRQSVVASAEKPVCTRTSIVTKVTHHWGSQVSMRIPVMTAGEWNTE